MSIREHIDADDVLQERKFKAEIKADQEKLSQLRDFADLKDAPTFQQWMLIYVVKPLNDTFTASLTELDTNKSFVEKGKLKAYNKQSKWMDDVNAQINNLVESIHKKEVDLHNSEESQKPEN